MKKIYLFLLVLVAVFVACKKDMDVEFSTFEVENEKISPSYTSTELSCKVRCAATINELYLQYDTVADFATYQEVELVEDEKREVYSVKIDDLLDNTIYYVRYVAVNSYSQVTSEEVSEFKTLQATVPTIEVREIIDVLDTIATVGFVLKFNGGADVTKMGVCWSVDSVPTIEDKYVECSRDAINCVSDGDSLVLKISGLEANTTYYVRAYAENNKGVGYSENKTFITLALPEVKTEDVSDIQLTSALLNGLVLFNGNDTTTEYGFCWGEEENLTIEESQNVKVEVTEDSTFTYRLSNLQDETKYYVRAYATNKIGVEYGETVEFETLSRFVDLGLSVKWATCNVGATTPEEYGDYFAWGEVEPKEYYDWLTYKYYDGSKFTKYYTSNSYGIVDNKIVLDLKDDAATVNWGGNWRMPTKAEQDELKCICTWEWITLNGVNGYKVIGPKGNSIFLPAAGCMYKDTIIDVGSFVCFWSSSLDVGSPYNAYDASSGDCNFDWSDNRFYGFSVRPVYGEPSQQLNVKQYTILVYSHDNSRGTVSGSGTYYEGSHVTITATAKADYQFKEWNDGNTDNPRVITITKDAIYTAYFEKEVKQYTIFVYSIEDSYGTVSGSGVYDEGSQVMITVTAKSGYKFTEWNDGNTDNPRVITVTKDAIYTAHFEAEKNLNAGHEYVDLGLSVKWATCNVGATSPEDYGDYFAWGEVEPKEFYVWSNYKYSIGETQMLKYSPRIDHNTELDIDDDVAIVNWGDSWRIPTYEELMELRTNCVWRWINKNGIEGYCIIGKNGNSIFLPAAGYKYEDNLESEGWEGYYWASSLYISYPNSAYALYFDSDYVSWYNNHRCYGQSIRPVCK